MGDRATAERVFTDFVAVHEHRLRRALVATYGPVVGRDAAVDALSWAWEHWDRVAELDNPVGYLYRVGQTAASQHLRARPAAAWSSAVTDAPEATPELLPALADLSEQQRAVVVLVHGYGISQREVSDLLGISVSTVREHLSRGMTRLRAALAESGPDQSSPPWRQPMPDDGKETDHVQ
jgi:DNA-directed RNA polymerase specialized sigma24 family protein